MGSSAPVQRGGRRSLWGRVRHRLHELAVTWTALRDDMRASLWFIPGVAALAAIGLATWLPDLEQLLGERSGRYHFFDGGADAARELLSTIASSMITFTALVFSVTLLVLQLASGQFSPRVVRTFLEEPMTKGAMATFIGTFVYALVLLAKVRGEPDPLVPALSVWVAFVLVLVSVGVFLRYIDVMAQSVRAVTLLRRIAEDTRRSIERLVDEARAARPLAGDAAAPASPADATLLNEARAGVVGAVDIPLLLRVACEHDVVVEVVARVGAFVPAGAPLVRVWGQSDAGDVGDIGLRRGVILEDERTPRQDPAFGFRQLVDIAVRALSPGINDPTTAVQALDHLHDLLRLLTTCPLPPVAHADEAGHLRLLLARCDYADYVRLAFEEIAFYGRESVQVPRRIHVAIDDLLTIAPSQQRRALEEARAALPGAAPATSKPPR